MVEVPKDQLWQSVLLALEPSLSKANFTTWFKETFLLDWTGQMATIAVPNAFTQSWLEKKYHRQIVQALERAADCRVQRVRYSIEPDRVAAAERVAREQQRVQVMASETEARRVTVSAGRFEVSSGGLIPKYSFDSYIVGKGNELAHAACQAASREPGLKYNPLFLYGGVGLGKTHLMHAVGHAIAAAHKEAKILYLTAEKFTNDFVRSLSEKGIGMERFRNFYRDVDVLLVDDIQFIAGKESTQEEFFHTFNALHQQNKQMIITSDRPPKSIPSLEQRLISRFEWGMIADIASPDFETRLAILQAKLRDRVIPLSPEVVSFLAAQIQNNVRELEGALNKLYAYYELSRIEITVDVAKSILESFTATRGQENISLAQLIQTVADFYEITLVDLTGACRKKGLVVPRQIAMFLLREELSMSYPSIGTELGGRDHTTAMHAYQKIVKELEHNARLKQEIELIKQKMYAR